MASAIGPSAEIMSNCYEHTAQSKAQKSDASEKTLKEAG